MAPTAMEMVKHHVVQMVDGVAVLLITVIVLRALISAQMVISDATGIFYCRNRVKIFAFEKLLQCPSNFC